MNKHYHLDNGIKYAETRSKVGTFTRDVSTATGTQIITGVGFKPSAIIIIANIHGSTQFSIGLTDIITTGSSFDDYADTANSWASSPPAGTNDLIYLAFTSSYNYIANSITFDSDGFTISWIKTGLPIGTAYLTFIAFR